MEIMKCLEEARAFELDESEYLILFVTISKAC